VLPLGRSFTIFLSPAHLPTRLVTIGTTRHVTSDGQVSPSRAGIAKSPSIGGIESGYNSPNPMLTEVAVKDRHRYGASAILWTGLLVLATSCAWAQESDNPLRVGVAQDWTQHHVVFSRDALAQHPDLIYNEPRIRQQLVQRGQIANWTASLGAETTPMSAESTSQRDWNVALANGRVAPEMFPAKYSFDPGAPPSCANDYVVMGLNVAGSSGHQANLVAFNNLYAGPGGLCGAAPTVMFAYTITTVGTGRILTSPGLSLDGKKIAFVESGSGSSVFHVVTWATGLGNGTITAAAVPGVGNTASMTSLTFAAALDTQSSPFVDYNTDTAYVGANDGNVYKITGVFNGTPVLAGAPWPVAISPGFHPSGPVVDKNLGLVMVGSTNATFYSIDATTGVVKSLVIGRSNATNPGVLAPPVVDVTNGTSFVVTANDSTSGVLVEVDSATMTQLAKARIGLASKSGTAVRLFQPAFDNNYFNDPSTGVVRLCGTGTADITPWQYGFGFTGRVLNTTAVFAQQLLNSTTARCTGWQEFFNPNVNGGTDFFFFGLTADCSGTGTSGCVVARTSDVSLTTADVSGGPSGMVVDNFSAAGQASSLYLSSEGTPHTANKFTQNGLQ
jgi:hypothetical protein